MKEVTEVGKTDICWDYGLLRKRAIDPTRFCNLHFGTTPWRAMIMRAEGTSLIDSTHTLEKPAAVFPTWEYGQQWETLEKMVKSPVGENPSACSDKDTPVEYRPVLGQEHRVVVIRPPAGNTSIGKAFLRILSELQEENPECIIHVHGLYSFRIMFGLEFRSVDFEARTHASKGRVVLPSGKVVSFEQATQEPHWVTLLGSHPVDLKIPRNRCMFNIKSASWAAEHFKEAVKFKTKGFTQIDPDNPFKKMPRNNTIMVKRVRSSAGDKWICNTCNLQLACKYYREGAVCIVPESEPVELARFFKTRDSGTIIEGLGTLLAAQSQRLSKALVAEGEKEELHPETTKIINTLFDRGVKLAKLVDPSLAASSAPRVTQNNLTQINASTPQALMASIVEEFVKQGIPRSQITPDMVLQIIKKPEDVRGRAIEVASQEANPV